MLGISPGVFGDGDDSADEAGVKAFAIAVTAGFVGGRKPPLISPIPTKKSSAQLAGNPGGIKLTGDDFDQIGRISPYVRTVIDYHHHALVVGK